LKNGFAFNDMLFHAALCFTILLKKKVCFIHIIIGKKMFEIIVSKEVETKLFVQKKM